MADYAFRRPTRRCAATERELAPGEAYYTVLILEGSEIARYDYSEKAWEGAPEEAIGWWKSRMPDATSKKAKLAPPEVILEQFVELTDEEGKDEVRYLTALMLVRRKVLRLDDIETDEQGQQHLALFCPKNETEYRVAVAPPDEEQMAAIQEELGALLYQ